LNRLATKDYRALQCNINATLGTDRRATDGRIPRGRRSSLARGEGGTILRRAIRGGARSASSSGGGGSFDLAAKRVVSGNSELGRGQLRAEVANGILVTMVIAVMAATFLGQIVSWNGQTEALGLGVALVIAALNVYLWIVKRAKKVAVAERPRSLGA
jgi:hypothetical protein